MPKDFFILGPPPLKKAILSFVTTLYRPDLPHFDVHQISNYFSSENSPFSMMNIEHDHKDHKNFCFPNIQLPNGFTLKPIYLCNPKEKTLKQQKYLSIDKNHSFSVCHAFDVKRIQNIHEFYNKHDILCYAIHSPDSPGNLDSKKAQELGVPMGPEMGKLSRGEQVKTSSGRIVTSKECMTPSIPGGITLIIDCPNEEFIEILSSNLCLLSYLSKKDLIYVFHITPLSVLLHRNYIHLFSSSSNVKHIFIFDNLKYGSPIYLTSNELQIKLQSVLTDLVSPCLFEVSFENIAGLRKLNKDHLSVISSHYRNAFIGDVTSTLHFHPVKKIKYESSDLFIVSFLLFYFLLSTKIFVQFVFNWYFITLFFSIGFGNIELQPFC